MEMSSSEPRVILIGPADFGRCAGVNSSMGVRGAIVVGLRGMASRSTTEVVSFLRNITRTGGTEMRCMSTGAFIVVPRGMMFDNVGSSSSLSS